VTHAEHRKVESVELLVPIVLNGHHEIERALMDQIAAITG
jgi:hypothetical protein